MCQRFTIVCIQTKLICHFNIAFIKNEIKWPKRMREKQADDIAKLTEDMRIESE